MSLEIEPRWPKPEVKLPLPELYLSHEPFIVVQGLVEVWHVSTPAVMTRDLRVGIVVAMEGHGVYIPNEAVSRLASSLAHEGRAIDG